MRFSHKVLLIPGIAVGSFATALAINELTASANAKLIGEIRDGYLPGLELSRDASVSILEIQRQLQDAVAASDPDGLREADVTSSRLLGRMEHAQKLETLRGLFAVYYPHARSTAGRMLRHEVGESLQPAIEQLTRQFNAVQEEADALNARERRSLDEALEQARANHRRATQTMAIALCLGALALSLVSRAVIRSTVGAVRRASADAMVVLSRSRSRAASPAAESGDELAMLLASLQSTMSALAESETRYRTLFDDNPMPMWLYDVETLRFLTVNAAAVMRYGYSPEEFLKMTVLDLQPEEDRRQAEGAAPARVLRHRRKDGSLLDVEITSHGMAFAGQEARLVLAHDVTEKLRLEQQLRQSHKMEAIGRLAGGVAHDFNNMLSVVLGYSQMIESRLPAGDPLRAKASGIVTAVDRASALTRQLLTFSRKQPAEPQVLDLNAIVADLQKMLHRLIGENIDIRTRLAEGICPVTGDPGQLEQVLMNLCVNARDAMPDGGTLTIETREIQRDAQRYVMLVVNDTGGGIDNDTRSRLFEPFFTTKGVGKGTGLGLAIVYGIVQQCGGHIEVHSEKGHGATFRLYFPRAEGRPVRDVVGTLASAPPSGNGTILVVEDEAPLRTVIADALQQNGYRVLEAATPWQALDIAESHRGAIDAVLTDLIMPGLTGVDLTKRLEPLRPRIAVLYMSGYTDEVVGKLDLPLGTDSFLQKPFTFDALLRKLHDRLAASAADAEGRSVGIPAA